MTDERRRIDFLIERDGLEATRIWVARTLKIYRAARESATGMASAAEYRAQFDRAIREYEDFLAGKPR